MIHWSQVIAARCLQGATFIEADLSDSHTLAKTLTDQKFEAVMHFAAFIEAGESMKDPGRFYHNNLTNSLDFNRNGRPGGSEAFRPFLHSGGLSIQR